MKVRWFKLRPKTFVLKGPQVKPLEKVNPQAKQCNLQFEDVKHQKQQDENTHSHHTLPTIIRCYHN